MIFEVIPEHEIKEGVVARTMCALRYNDNVFLIGRDFGTTILIDDSLYKELKSSLCSDELAFKLVQRGLAYTKDSPHFETFNKVIAPHFFILDLANKCNFECLYCFRGDALDGSKIISNEMLSNVLLYIINFCHSKEIKNISIQAWGGEPIIAFSQIIKICKIMAQEKIDCRVTIMTNASLITEDIARTLHDNHVDVGISLDGPADIQNLQRPLRGGKNSYEKTVNGIQLLNRAGYKGKLGTISVITKNSVNRIHDIIRHIVCDLDIFCLKLNLIKSTDAQCLTKEEIIIYCSSLLEELIAINEEGYFVTEGTVRDRLKNLIDRSNGNICNSNGCCGGYRMISFDPNGNIYPCEMTDFPEEKFGNINNCTDLTTVIKEATKSSDYFKEKFISKCKNCAWWPYCRGGCTTAVKYRGLPVGMIDENECILNRYLYPKLVKLIMEQPDMAQRLSGEKQEYE